MSILAPDDLQALVESGLATRSLENGTYELHKRRMNRSSDEEHASVPLIPITSPNARLHFTTIPAKLISEATLRYLGFSKARAYRIWNIWRNWPYPREIDNDDDGDPAGPMTFIDIVLLQLKPVDKLDDYYEDDAEWYSLMNDCGISYKLQMAIMDPCFTSIRRTNSCLYWLRDTIEMRYLGLQEIQDASNERDMAIRLARSQPGGPQQWVPSPGSRSISGTIRERAGNSRHTSTSQFSLRAARRQPGYTILFRGISQVRLTSFRQSEERFRVSELMSRPPTDFLWGSTGGYFALDRDVAIRYAQYAKKRDENTSAVLLQFNVPNSAIESLPEDQLTMIHWDPSGNDKTWEKLVYYSRNEGSGPRAFGEIALRTTLLIGTIATKPNSFYGRMRSYEEITENCVMRNKEGRPAVQYVFHGDHGKNFLEEHLIPIMQDFPVTSAELAALRLL